MAQHGKKGHFSKHVERYGSRRYVSSLHTAPSRIGSAQSDRRLVQTSGQNLEISRIAIYTYSVLEDGRGNVSDAPRILFRMFHSIGVASERGRQDHHTLIKFSATKTGGIDIDLVSVPVSSTGRKWDRDELWTEVWMAVHPLPQQQSRA